MAGDSSERTRITGEKFASIRFLDRPASCLGLNGLTNKVEQIHAALLVARGVRRAGFLHMPRVRVQPILDEPAMGLRGLVESADHLVDLCQQVLVG